MISCHVAEYRNTTPAKYGHMPGAQHSEREIADDRRRVTVAQVLAIKSPRKVSVHIARPIANGQVGQCDGIVKAPRVQGATDGQRFTGWQRGVEEEPSKAKVALIRVTVAVVPEPRSNLKPIDVIAVAPNHCVKCLELTEWNGKRPPTPILYLGVQDMVEGDVRRRWCPPSFVCGITRSRRCPRQHF